MDTAPGSAGTLVHEWDNCTRTRENAKEIKQLIARSVQDSRLLLSTEPDAVDIDTIQQVVGELAVEYLATAPRPMLERTLAVQRELARRLASHAVRAAEVADACVALSRTSGILAYAALDLGHPDAAAVHARTSFTMAERVGDSTLQAWIRGTQSLIARFERNYNEAQWFVEDGLRYAGAGTSEVRLLCGAGQCAANLGDTDGALRFLEAADRARDRAGTDPVEGLFGFSPAKQAYYAGSSLMWSPDKRALAIAARSAERAISTWQHEPPAQRSLDDEALAHVYLATARLHLGEIDGALDAVRPILDLPAERQISWLRRRVGELATILTQDRYRNSPHAAAAVTELTQHSNQ